jgi:hypothetical protein
VGAKSLYYYNDKFGKQNFYINQWPDFELLVYKKYLKPNKQKDGNDYNESTNIIAENKKFVGQLLLYLQDCPGIKSKINTTAYHMKGMESLFKSYYDCSHSTTSYTYKKEKLQADFGALAGVSVTKLKLTTELAENFRPYSNVDYNPSYNFSGGIFMDVVMARNQRKWSIYSELLYSDYKATSHVEDRTNENSYSIYDITVGYTYLELNFMLRFTYPLKNDLFVFGNAGLSLGHAISETNLLVTETKFYSTPVISEGSAIKETRLNEQGIIAGVGSRYKKYSFETRFQRSNGMSVYSNLGSKTNQLYVLLGYRF